MVLVGNSWGGSCVAGNFGALNGFSGQVLHLLLFLRKELDISIQLLEEFYSCLFPLFLLFWAIDTWSSLLVLELSISRFYFGGEVLRLDNWFRHRHLPSI